jgi:hypothetical protein
MRIPFVIALAISATIAFAQTDLWSHVSPRPAQQRLEPATLSQARLESVAQLLRHQKPEDVWDCEGTDLDDVIKGLRFESIPVSPKQNLVLAEAPAGCARGGQGANGAMWIIRFDGDTPTLLTNPKEFSGWLFSIQPTKSRSYPDIVLGWHMSAFEANLSYFRFDGKSYRWIAAAKLETDDQENQKIVPTPQ